MTRRSEALSLRTAAATAQADMNYGTQETNGDEGLYSDYRASFTKALPHNDLGEVDVSAFDTLLGALQSGQNSQFEAVSLGGTRKLANPQGAYRYELVGLDSHKTFMRPAPAFESAETAAEMAELYWKALCRDVPFADFGTNTMVQAAVTDLNKFSETVGPKQGGSVTTGTIFRGETPGDLTGPYISQFLLKDIPYGNGKIQQTYDCPAPGDDFMTTEADWLSIQRGFTPSPLVKGNPRYISDARVLGEFVHKDYSYQAYLNAALILLSIGVKDYGLPAELVNSDAITQTHANFGTHFLPQAFPEGSPTHPSYPAGHATIAGACSTVLKAFFEESLPVPNPVVTTRNGDRLESYNGRVTIGDEINKLANNIALGRDWAGVHYRSDGVDGLAVGEQQAIGLLQDYSRTYREQFNGFNLTKFDGTAIRISKGEIY